MRCRYLALDSVAGASHRYSVKCGCNVVCNNRRETSLIYGATVDTTRYSVPGIGILYPDRTYGRGISQLYITIYPCRTTPPPPAISCQAPTENMFLRYLEIVCLHVLMSSIRCQVPGTQQQQQQPQQCKTKTLLTPTKNVQNAARLFHCTYAKK